MSNQLIIILYASHLGFGRHVSRGNLAKANENCGCHILKSKCYYY